MKKTSCGILLKVNDKILLGRSTGNLHWDIPKGIKHENEEPLEAAVRETFEETGLKVEKKLLKENGVFNLNNKKNLHLFETNKVKFKVEELICHSMVVLPEREPFPEMDKFGLFTKEEAIEKVYPSLKKVLQDVL